ncbi:PREDICTED: uncharacterized protein LOC108569211, partial [Nicrophorus vespilloides]|uniref:Uncharacterized protein LOC108569211 n=1 Tax=Nicrophorus vespilloides TaxID=110193 RepID=A0ABM1NH61_NICVS
MESILFAILVSALAFVQGKNCDSLGTLIYEDLGCKAKGGNNNTCPISYDCPQITVKNGTCKFGGTIYKEGNRFNGTNVCMPAVCMSSGIGRMVIDCNQRPEEGCYFANTLDKCCSIDQICDSFDDVEICNVTGRLYLEGEYFTPKGYCLHCICKPNFAGKFVAPFCERIRCGIELTNDPISDKSAPLYLNSPVRCCPIQFIKPTNAIVTHIILSGSSS